MRALLARSPQRVQRVLLCSAGATISAHATIEALARAARVGRRTRATPTRCKRLVGDVAHQGVVAEIEPLPPWREDDLLAAVGRRRRDPLVLALDGVQDPHNLGACLRTADACGVLAVVVPRDRAAQLKPTARKVAAGAAETTPVVTVTNLARTLKLLKDAGLWIVGADAEADAAGRRAST